ncbi:lytic transglycosylase domain-containing protein [Subtercola vilae]|uniref:lytic transglycosylase domain-containing protein n=1 Tax=Subtercola vilae TaxID=2056433 RepID=UPI001F2FF728|nr:lytic murein transglycosylase [Subtercola vilae]
MVRALLVSALVLFGLFIGVGLLTPQARGLAATGGSQGAGVAEASAVGSNTAAATQSAGGAGGDAALVDPTWATASAARTGIPYRALVGYAGTALALARELPQCHVGWNTLAALGSIESAHGTHAGSTITADGAASPAIYGPALDGSEYPAVSDTDGGALDGTANGDRAVGPLQFIPSTWMRWGADGNGDGVSDPQQIDDASLAAGRYLCSYGDLSGAAGWRASVFAYNHVESYVDAVAETANRYAAAVG